MTQSPDYQRDFLHLALEYQCLKFGRFTLKSGRESPYFFNAAAFNDGAAMDRIGACYAQAITDANIRFDMLFGPAYKGIPLATATACAFYRLYQRSVPVAFDRKEAKTYGDGGQTFAAPIQGRVLLIDDVLSSGMTIRASAEMIRAQGATIAGLIVLLDRGEKGQEEAAQSAAQELKQHCDIPVFAVARAQDFRRLLHDAPQYQKFHDETDAYLERYGA